MSYPIRFIVDVARLARNRPLSSLAVVFVLFLAMSLSGAFWIASKNLIEAAKDFRDSLTVDIFLQDDLSAEELASLRARLDDLAGSLAVTYISPEKALFKMREIFGRQMIEGLEENPLPVSFALHVNEKLLSSTAVDSLVEQLAHLPGVEEVVFPVDAVKKLDKLGRSLNFLGFSVAIAVLLATVVIVANTVRLTISEQRKTIEIMRLVGGTRNYILAPFISFGGILGLVAALLSVSFLAFSIDYVADHFIPVIFLGAHETLAFVLSGLLVGMVGAELAAAKYLRI